MTVSLKANVSLKAVSYLETPPPEETFKVSLTRVSDDSRFRKRLCGQAQQAGTTFYTSWCHPSCLVLNSEEGEIVGHTTMHCGEWGGWVRGR